jgi:hypothetical protein
VFWRKFFEELDDFALMVSIPTSLFCLGMQLFFTYWYGYHTLQQMFLGGTIGISYCIAIVITGEYYFWRTSGSIVQYQ